MCKLAVFKSCAVLQKEQLKILDASTTQGQAIYSHNSEVGSNSF